MELKISERHNSASLYYRKDRWKLKNRFCFFGFPSIYMYFFLEEQMGSKLLLESLTIMLQMCTPGFLSCATIFVNKYFTVQMPIKWNWTWKACDRMTLFPTQWTLQIKTQAVFCMFVKAPVHEKVSRWGQMDTNFTKLTVRYQKLYNCFVDMYAADFWTDCI